MKNQLIRDRHTALTAMANRVLPSSGSINKVATLLTVYFQQPFETVEVKRKLAMARFPVPDGWEGEAPPLAIGEQRTMALDRLMAESTAVKRIPDRLRLTSADLPKVLKRDGGEGNAEGVAQIISMLGSLYVRTGDEVASTASDPTGEEPDEIEAPKVDPMAPAPDAVE